MKKDLAELEKNRTALQKELDAARDRTWRNRMGQFATPPELAADIVGYAKEQLDETAVRFLDPAVGTGSFYSALLGMFQEARVDAAVGYEIDPHYGEPATKLWSGTGLDVRLDDFTLGAPPERSEKFNLLICNPPYVRHHHIRNEEKRRLKIRARELCGIEVDGLSGLYCYFLVLCHEWMSDAGLAGWLIPSEFMDVNYGASVKRYLLEKVTLLHIHRFDPNDVQFEDALVSSAVVWLRNEPPSDDHEVLFTYGGSIRRPRVKRLVSPEILRGDPKWTRYPMKESRGNSEEPVLGDFFRVKRGLVTGNNRYFILSAEEIERRGLPMEVFLPILPSPRYLHQDEVSADEKGNPVLEHRLFLLDCHLDENDVRKRYPGLWAYLEEGRARGIAERYLCRHRTPWYLQERRSPAPFLCTYLGRSDSKTGRPFRFILNDSKATAANVYLMLYPREPLARTLEHAPVLKRNIWEFLNGISPDDMLDKGRVYGGGLHKLEPKELENVPATKIAGLLPESARVRGLKQGELFGASPR